MQPTSPVPIAVACEPGTTLVIEPPAGWVMAAPTPPARLYIYDPTAPGPVQPNINVLVQDMGHLTPDEYITLSRLQCKALGDQARIEHDEAIGPAHAGHIFELLLAPGASEPLRSRQLILLHSRSAYVITATALAYQFHAYRPILERALESVALSISAP